MANIKISELTLASGGVLTSTEFEVNQTGDSRKVTGQQILDLVDSNLGNMAQQYSSSVTITGGSISGITDLAIADGGTGASTAQAARNNLLPTQTGNTGRFLTTNGTDVSWANTGVTDGDKGDISVTGSGTVWSIDPGTITTTKILDGNVTTAKLNTISGLTAGTYGSSSQIPSIEVDNKGRVIAISSNNLTIPVPQIRGELFTTSGTFTVPDGVTQVKVIVIAGGGGSFNASTAGGMGGVAIAIVPVTPNTPIAVTVGAGGAVQAAGGPSSFGTLVTCTGGTTNTTSGVGTVTAGTTIRTSVSSRTTGSALLGIPYFEGATSKSSGAALAWAPNSIYHAGAAGLGASFNPQAGVGGVVFVEWVK
jgi:hypothetical protein